jgi:hypothetical protein
MMKLRLERRLAQEAKRIRGQAKKLEPGRSDKESPAARETVLRALSGLARGSPRGGKEAANCSGLIRPTCGRRICTQTRG